MVHEVDPADRHALTRFIRSERALVGDRPHFYGDLDANVRKYLGATLAASLYRNLEAQGLRKSFYYPVNDSNVQSRGLAESLGGEGRILHHCFVKEL